MNSNKLQTREKNHQFLSQTVKKYQ